MKKKDFQAGMTLLRQPVLPLVYMVQLMCQFGGPQTKVEDIISEMPEPLETGYTVYEQPRQLLHGYLAHLNFNRPAMVSKDQESKFQVIDESGQPVDEVTASTALINQRILEDELKAINSLLCSPCNCTLCCIGPDKDMRQEFFEIPLQNNEADFFRIPRHDTTESCSSLAMDDSALQIDGRPFYQCAGPELFNWQNGWSMIMPKNSSCPNLGVKGRCQIYPDRPDVCRRPQIFGYILEQTEQPNQYMLRNTLLAVADCPYVQLLREEITAYAAASELDLIFKKNKE